MFDSLDELLRKIQLGEDSVFEYKSIYFKGDKISGPRREDLGDELAAFANTNEGVFILGVNDKTKEIEGIPIEKIDRVETYLREICNDHIKPPLFVRIIKMELPDTFGDMHPIIKIEIPKSLFVHKSPGGYFYRQGSSKRELSPDLLARLFQQRSQARIFSFEEQAVPETSFNTLDISLYKIFIKDSLQDHRAMLQKLRLLTEDDNGIDRATVAGVLLCSKNPEVFLPGAYIEAVRYRGKKQDSNYQIDAARITGPLHEQIHYGLTFALRNMTISATKDPSRWEIPQFSNRALFEAIVNAVAHRDYSIHGSKIRLFMFDDRLELYSPGALPNTVTIDTMPFRQATRNELITSLLSRCPIPETDSNVKRRYLMEKRGEGVPIIIEESKLLSGRPPEYRLIDDTELLLTIYSAIDRNSLN